MPYDGFKEINIKYEGCRVYQSSATGGYWREIADGKLEQLSIKQLQICIQKIRDTEKNGRK